MRLHTRRALDQVASVAAGLILPLFALLPAENIQGHHSHPVELTDSKKLVLSPHVYGHGNHQYFEASNFPQNMPSIWWQHWARIPSQTGHAVVVGEWGGLWEEAFWKRDRPSTKLWQQKLASYLMEQGIGHFYWTLNDNSYSTGEP